MSRFENRLQYEDQDNGTFVVLAPLRYRTAVSGRDALITVPAGFVTDNYSVPKSLQWFVASG